MTHRDRSSGSIRALCTFALGAVAALTLALAAIVPSRAYADGICRRVSGDTRYDTMSSLVTDVGGWKRSGLVVLASGANYPDALSASSYAGCFDAPIILTDPFSLSPQAANLLRVLSPNQIVVVGGPGAVSDNVMNEASSVAGCEASRLSGETRYETSIEIMKLCESYSGTVIVATGGNYADSLSISPFAFATSSPVVLCDSSSGLTQRAIDAVRDHGFSNAILVGGSNAVPDVVIWQLRSAGISVESITRLSGETRYDTSIKIAEWEINQTKLLDADGLGFATGSNFVDALAMGPCLGHKSSPILLVDDGASVVCGYAQRFKGSVGAAFVAGGPNAVSQHDFDAIEAALTPGSSNPGTGPSDPAKRTVDVPGPTSLVYNGSRQTALSDTSDYTVRSGSATDAGTYTAVLSLRDKSGCVWASTGSSDDIRIQWSISPAEISDASVSIASQTFTGSALAPDAKVNVNDRTLSVGIDYSVSYSNNVHAGSAKVTVSGRGNYTGNASARFRINPADLSGADVEVGEQRYTGSPLTPEPRVTLNGRVLSANADYTVTYSHNTSIGTASISVSGKGDYTGIASGSFKIGRGDATSRRVKIGEVTVTVYTYDDGYSYVDIPSDDVSINSCVNLTRSIETKDSSKDENANVDIWDNNGLTSQIWKFICVSVGVYRVQNAYSGKVLGVADDDVYTEGANIVQQSWNDRDGQKWQAALYNDKLMLINLKSGLALDCKGGSIECGTNIQLWKKNNSNAQLFELRTEKIITKGTKSIYVNNVRVTQTAEENGNRYYEIPEGTYIIQSCAGSNQVLDLYWGNKDNGTNVETWQDNGGNGQKWKFVRAGNGIYMIYSVASDKCLEVAGQDSGVNGGNVQQWDYADGWSNKLWKLWLTKDSKLMFLNCASWRALNVSGGKASNGVNVNVLDRDMSDAQAWILKPTSKKIDSNEECQRIANETWAAVCAYRQKNGLYVPSGNDSFCDGCAAYDASQCAASRSLTHDYLRSYRSSHSWNGWNGVGENLATAHAGASGKSIVNRWWDDSGVSNLGHRKALNDPAMRVCGVKVAYNSSNDTYYVSMVYAGNGLGNGGTGGSKL